MICGTGWTVQTTDRLGNAPFLGAGRQKVGWAKSTPVSDADFRWNPAFWRGVDRKVQYANDHGMIAFFCAIGQNHNGHHFPKTDRTQVELFARNFAARMMGDFVIFSPDADYYWTESGDWSGSTLRSSMHPLQLVTIHPEMIVNLYAQTPANSGTLGFYDKPYVDFAGFEVSNGWLAIHSDTCRWLTCQFDSRTIRGTKPVFARSRNLTPRFRCPDPRNGRDSSLLANKKRWMIERTIVCQHTKALTRKSTPCRRYSASPL